MKKKVERTVEQATPRRARLTTSSRVNEYVEQVITKTTKEKTIPVA